MNNAKGTKRILLTGASGFIGSHTLQHFLENTNWEVVCICSWQHKGTPERVEQVLSKNSTWKDRVTIITHDLQAPLTTFTKKRLGDIDYIVNIASESHVDRSITDPVPFMQNNVNLIVNMLELAREIKPKVFFQISTDEVYGVAPRGVNHAEWSPIVPSNPYSASKAAQEAICISYWRTYNVPLIITNTMNNFGEMQDSEKYIAQLIKKIQLGQGITIHGTPEDIGSRYYLHARNHADAILFILQNTVPKLYNHGENLLPDRYNVVGEKELNNFEVAELVAKLMNKGFTYEFVNFHFSRSGHDQRYALDGKKLVDLGWKAPYSLEESLKKTIDWTLANSQWLQ